MSHIAITILYHSAVMIQPVTHMLYHGTVMNQPFNIQLGIHLHVLPLPDEQWNLGLH